MNYKAENFYMIRTPMFSEAFLNLIIQDKENIMTVINNDIFLEGIQIASSDLYQMVMDIKNNSLHQTTMNKIINTLFKYAVRASSRTTPFGLFSGFCIGSFGNSTEMILGNRDTYKKRARADMEWINGIVRKLEDNKQFMKTCKVYRSSVLYKKGDRIINPYLCSENLREKKVIDISASIRFTKQIVYAFELCEEGIELEQLECELCKEYPNVEIGIIKAFLWKLLENGFLISELKMPKSNVDAIDYLIAVLEKQHQEKQLLTDLHEINRLIRNYNQTAVGEGAELFHHTESKMKSLVESRNYLQVDYKMHMIRSTISTRLKEDCENLVTNMVKLSRCIGNYPHIYEYKMDFMDKYGIYTEVPLLELLDPELGLGAPAGYTYPSSDRLAYGKNRDDKSLGAGDLKEYLLTSIAYASYSGLRDVELSDDDICHMNHLLEKYNNHISPASLEVNIMIYASSEQAIREGRYKLALGPNVGADKAGKTLGRFSDMLTEKEKERYNTLYYKTKDLLKKEYLLVEIIEEPMSSRVGNIILNNNSAEYQTTIGCIENEEKKKIELSDIVVGVDAKSNQFYLKSRSMNKKIKFTVFHMLNPMGASNIYRFVREISSIGDYNFIRLIHGLLMDELVYVPRITYRNCILVPRTWKLTHGQLNSTTRFDIFKKNFNQWRKNWNLPEVVYQKQMDDLMLTDFRDIQQLQNLHRTLMKDKMLMFVEYDSEQNWVIDCEGKSYFAEFIIPFFKNEQVLEKKNISNELSTKSDYTDTKAPITINEQMRSLTPGADGWWYIKLYCANHNIDTILSKDIEYFCRNNAEKGLFNKFFFIRYADPNPHIRLRIQLAENNSVDIIGKWLNTLKTQAKITNMSINLYERELERYGGPLSYDLVEDFFYLDSFYVAKLLKEKVDAESDEQLVVMSNLTLLADFGLNLDEQIIFFENNLKKLDYFKKEFKPYTRNYLEMLDKPEMFLPLKNVANSNEDVYEDIKRLFIERNHAFKAYIDALRYYDSKGKLTNSITDILLSLMHMHCNRFRGDTIWEKKTLEFTYRSLYAYRNYMKYRQ